MAGIPCPNNDGGTCYPPSTALVLFKGTYSLVSRPLLEAAFQFERLLERAEPMAFRSSIPPEVIGAAGFLDHELGLALSKYQVRFKGEIELPTVDAVIQSRRRPKSASAGGDGVLLTCTCGHGPFKLAL